jgi:hypothetical protein
MVQLLYNLGQLTRPVGPQIGNVGSWSMDKASRLSSHLPGADVDGAWDGSWGCLCFISLYLDAKPFYVGADVDGLACHLHYPTEFG